ncbi:MAG: peptidase MA family metallohydrolase, partial [Thermomicrobiales bacterium]
MNRPGRFRRPLAALALLIALGCSAGIAQPIRGAEPIRVSSSSAKADFPKGMTFHLDADGDSTITRVELLFTKASLETLHLVTPKFTPARRIAIDATSDFQIDFVPPGIDVSYHWRLTDVDGRTTEIPPLSVLWEDTRFDWKSISTPQVTVYAYNGNDAFDQIVLDSSQKTIDRLQDEFGVKKSLPIRIWVYNSKKDFSGSQAPNSQDWIAGTAYPAMPVVLAVLPEGDKHEVGRIIPHETSHQMLNQATKNPFNSPPTWLDEGLAVSNQDNGNEDFPAIVGRASAENRLLSIRALTSEFPYDPAQATLAYAES